MSEIRRDLDLSGVTGPTSYTDIVQTSITALEGLVARLFEGLLLRLPIDGSVAMTGDLDMGTNDLVNVGLVDGRDVSVDGARFDGILPMFNGMAEDQPAVSITYTGGPVANLLLEKTGGGNIQVQLEGSLHTFVSTTIALTAGTDTVPQINYVWVKLVTGTATLQTSTSGFPATGDYLAVATVLIQSAASAQTDGVYKMHAWTDFVGGASGQGHLPHLNHWIRHQPATWQSGIGPTITIVGASSPDDVFFSSTSGFVLQLHDHDYPAMDMDGVNEAHVVNDSVTPFDRITNLNQLLTDSTGASMSNKAFTLVFWGVVSEDANDCQLMINLPAGSYNNTTAAIADQLNYDTYAMPAGFVGTGFLIAAAVFDHSPSGGGTWTLAELQDLRGLFPNSAAGAGSVGIATDHGLLSGLADDDHAQYHNDARGDARYPLIAHTHTLTDVTDSGALAALSTVGTTEIDALAVTTGKIAAKNVTYPKMPDLGEGSFMARSTASLGSPEAVAAPDALTLLDPFMVPPLRFEATDFLENDVNGNSPFDGVAISGGSSGTVPPDAALGAGIMGAVMLKSDTSANSGFRWFTDSNRITGMADLFFLAKVYWNDDFTNKTVRPGLHDSISSSDASDGTYFEINTSGSAVAKSATSSTRTTSGVTFSLTADTYYIFEIYWTSASSVNYKILSADRVTTHYDEDITTNLPTATSRAFGSGLVATSAGTIADNLVTLDFMGVGLKTTRM